jgi:hypothetical protein
LGGKQKLEGKEEVRAVVSLGVKVCHPERSVAKSKDLRLLFGGGEGAMTDNGSKTRPVRTLTVKNFSVIKDAVTVPLEFGKITVLIGPQASGKSLLCKLAYFFQKTLLDFAGQHAIAVLDDRAWERLVGDSFRESFCSFFPPYSWGKGDFRIEYKDGVFNPIVSRTAHADSGTVFNMKTDLKLTFGSDHFEEAFNTIRTSLRETIKVVPPSMRDARLGENIYKATADLQRLQGDPDFSVHSYIPDTRSIFSTLNPAYAATRIGSDDPVVIAFSRQVDYEYKKNYPPVGTTDIVRQMDDESRKILRGEVVFSEIDGMARFREKDERQLPLTELSSGTRELLPLITHLAKYVYDENANFRAILGLPSREERISDLPQRAVFVEEPESNVFPSTQNDLMRLFAWMTNSPRINLSLVITTHSPYILSAFNNLIEASQVAVARPEMRGEVARMIPEKYWIKSSDFKAYSIHDGNLESIMDEDTGLINGAYLDAISNKIGADFDELLRMGYVKS